ncbi:MAG: hypothetical protein Q9226_006972 [Calogaya cf. arnoldii]
MTTSNNPRTVETLDLSQFGRQLHQWYFNEMKSMSQIKGSFDIFFRRLYDATGVKCDIKSVDPPEMMRSYSGPPMTGPCPAVPDIVDNWPFVQEVFEYQYSPHMGVNPSHLNLQGQPQTLNQYNFATGNQGALLPYRTAPAILGSTETETSVEPRRATPVSRKRSRINSVEPDRVVEVPVETEDVFNDWLT